MIDTQKIKAGDKVHYQPEHFSEDKWENGIVQDPTEITGGYVRVVYHCAGEWDDYMSYTGALTRSKNLNYGWK